MLLLDASSALHGFRREACSYWCSASIAICFDSTLSNYEYMEKLLLATIGGAKVSSKVMLRLQHVFS